MTTLEIDNYDKYFSDVEKFFKLTHWIDPQDPEGNNFYIHQVDQSLLTREITLEIKDLIECDSKHNTKLIEYLNNNTEELYANISSFVSASLKERYGNNVEGITIKIIFTGNYKHLSKEIIVKTSKTKQEPKEVTSIEEIKFTETSKPKEYADHIKSKYTFKTLRDTKEILVFQDGILNYKGDTLIEEEVQKLAGLTNSNNKVIEVKGHIKRETYFDRELLNQDFTKLVLLNGILNLDTLEFNKTPNTDILTTVKIPINYDPSATCPKFIKVLKECLVTKEKIIRVVECMANILTTNDATYEVVVLFYGKGSNGKSLILKIIRGVIGSTNCSSLDIHQIETDRFATSRLEGKLANIGGEISDRELTHTRTLKALTSYEPINAQKKGKDAFDMLSFAKHFFSANKMPEIKDDTDAIYRRIIPIGFEVQFLKENMIKDFDREILKEEASGIFNLMVQNYKTLMRNRNFRYGQTIGEVREIMKNEADRLRPFVTNCLILNAQGNYIVKDTLYEKVRDYFKFCGFDFEYTKNGLTPELVRHGLSDKFNGKDVVKKIDGKTTKVWRDVAWNTKNDWVKSNVNYDVKPTQDIAQKTLEDN